MAVSAMPHSRHLMGGLPGPREDGLSAAKPIMGRAPEKRRRWVSQRSADPTSFALRKSPHAGGVTGIELLFEPFPPSPACSGLSHVARCLFAPLPLPGQVGVR